MLHARLRAVPAESHATQVGVEASKDVHLGKLRRPSRCSEPGGELGGASDSVSSCG